MGVQQQQRLDAVDLRGTTWQTGKPWHRTALRCAPFISFYTPSEMLALAREAGFEDARRLFRSSRARSGQRTPLAHPKRSSTRISPAHSAAARAAWQVPPIAHPMAPGTASEMTHSRGKGARDPPHRRVGRQVWRVSPLRRRIVAEQPSDVGVQHAPQLAGRPAAPGQKPTRPRPTTARCA
ncbi:MAG TPA: hypothetical protein VHY31_27395 [Streptosporangiaceae bacterium]|nr:hypothetical protein [Streptosporangiaceae bacterium]